MNPYHEHHIVRIRRELKKVRYLERQNIYNYYRYELTIPVKFKGVPEQFINKNLKIRAIREDNSLIIEAQPINM